MKCEGFLSGREAEHCTECRHGFRACAKEKKVTRCYECGEFPCSRLEAFIPVHVEIGIVHDKKRCSLAYKTIICKDRESTLA